MQEVVGSDSVSCFRNGQHSELSCSQRLGGNAHGAGHAGEVSVGVGAQLREVVAVHTDIEACPHEELQVASEHPQCLVPGEKEHFLQVNSDLLLQPRHCPWKVLHHRCLKLYTNSSRVKYSGSLSFG